MFRFSARTPLGGLSISTDWFLDPDCPASETGGRIGLPKDCDVLRLDGPGPDVVAVGGLTSGDGDRESVKSMTA